MEWIFDIGFLAILFPIIGLLINLTIGRRLEEKGIGVVACIAAGLAFAISFAELAALIGSDVSSAERLLYEWVSVGSIHIPIAVRIDPLSVTMMLVVTGVGSIIHIYSIGYMHGDPRFRRFFVYLNLFLASMLILVMANNYVMMFIGWELVGLCSYLLIGFWFEDVKNAAAGKKAFVVNRVGDFGFILGVILIFLAFGTYEFTAVFETVEHVHAVQIWGLTFSMKEIVTVITLLLFVGATGKSAQIPLFVWLPDAMAGPTPVSALIHAATMVTAGIYMITRSAPMFELATLTSAVVTVIGALTALMAATIAVAQFDIKRVLAYSTISQLGFMIAAVGMGGYAAGMFHLVVHAFFKALLFLGAGSVIHGIEHGMHHDDQPLAPRSDAGPDPRDPQDMRNMGGLRHRMKWTFGTYVIGWLALAGLFPFAGFWSKDEILVDALAKHPVILIMLLTAAFLTAFYSTRQVILVFDGDPRSTAAARAHESGALMVGSLVMLAILTVLGGTLNLPGLHTLSDFIEHHAAEFNLGIAVTSTVIALSGIFVGWYVYSRGRIDAHAPDRLARLPFHLFNYMNRAWYWDEFYHLTIVRPFRWLAEKLAYVVDWEFWHDFVHDSVIAEPFNATAAFLANPIDLGVIDGIVNGVGDLTRRLSQGLRKVQTGYVRNYALSVLLGVIAILAWLLFG
jgi:NADH-quinone oxidoreductase subunit L